LLFVVVVVLVVEIERRLGVGMRSRSRFHSRVCCGTGPGGGGSREETRPPNHAKTRNARHNEKTEDSYKCVPLLVFPSVLRRGKRHGPDNGEIGENVRLCV
jgi:hypothetical protein